MIVTRPEAERLLGYDLDGHMKGRDGRKYRYWVLTESGDRRLGGPYTMEEAKKRIRQVETFKHIKNNPIKPFFDRDHDWDEVLIQHKGERRTRQQILNYYKANMAKIWPYLKGQTVMVYLAPSKNDFVLRRKSSEGDYIRLTKMRGIDNPSSFEYWIYRRAVEFHPVIRGHSTRLVWVDFDMHTTMNPRKRIGLRKQMQRAMPKVKRVMRKVFPNITRIRAWDSGQDGGIHLEAELERSVNVDQARIRLRKALDEAFRNDSVFVTGLAKTGQIRLDTTLIKNLGSLRAPYSYTVIGDYKRPLRRT